jgi:hypothetical protein
MAQKQIFRLALAIHGHLRQQQGSNIPAVELPESVWLTCQSMQRRLRRALAHDWQLAARRLDRDFNAQLHSLQDQIRQVVDDRTTGPAQHMPTVHDIYQDILSLKAEFEAVTWSIRQRTLSVTTSDVVLENIDLGRFQIELDWRELPDSTAFRVIALEPNPADSNDNVTHPHVESETLCVGDARLSLQYALEQGRIADFFLIVNNVLQTYNSGSPYVSLAEWHGVRCSDCGDSVSSDDCFTCGKCEDSLCESCYRYCEPCSGHFCCTCMASCKACDEDLCRDCQQSCKSCKSSFCPSCLEENLCDNCQQESDEAESDAAPTIEDAPTGTPSGARASRVAPEVHADCLEQAAVLS